MDLDWNDRDHHITTYFSALRRTHQASSDPLAGELSLDTDREIQKSQTERYSNLEIIVLYVFVTRGPYGNWREKQGHINEPRSGSWAASVIATEIRRMETHLFEDNEC